MNNQVEVKSVVEFPAAHAVDSPAIFPPALRIQQQSLSPESMLSYALSNNLSQETINNFIGLVERMRAINARTAFNNAIADARKEFGKITKNRHVAFDSKGGGARTDYWHEDLDAVMSAVGPALAKHGLGVRWNTHVEVDKPVVVTCIVFHRDGHQEETTLSTVRDGTGNKNPQQQLASAITYLQRYTVKAALGLAVSNDDDGAASGDTPLAIENRIGEFKRRFGACSSPTALAALADELKVESDVVREACRSAYQAARDRLGTRQRTAPPPTSPEEAHARPAANGAAALKGNALLDEVRRRFEAATTVADVDRVFDELVEPVKDDLPDADWQEISSGYQKTRSRLA